MSRSWPVRGIEPNAPVLANARRVLATRMAELYAYDPIVASPAATEALHDMRIAAKRLRYALELFRELFGARGERQIARIKKLQEVLGELHDHDIRLATIETELAAAADSPDLRAGLIALHERQAAARAGWHHAVITTWTELHRAGLRSDLVALSSTSPTKKEKRFR